jgi:hypothetical protein
MAHERKLLKMEIKYKKVKRTEVELFEESIVRACVILLN